MGFNSWLDFENFERKVKHENRYVHSDEVKEFLFNIKKSLPAREKSLTAGSILFRSQIGYDEHEDEGQLIIAGLSRDRMKPIQLKGYEGRANPKGISGSSRNRVGKFHVFQSLGSIDVSIFSRRYSSSRSPYARRWMTRILLL
ncbi:MAG: hypothetical protein Q8O64_13305, partial [Sideroxyarcus sp.]|nr:hypothetical protein [Sideroxyarcus sp.]